VNLNIIEEQKWFYQLCLGAVGLGKAEVGMIDDVNRANGEIESQRVFKRVTGPFRKQFEEAFLHVARQFDAFNDLGEPFTPTLAFSDPREERAKEERLRQGFEQGTLTLRQYLRRTGDEDLAEDDERFTVEIDGDTVEYGDHPQWVARRLLSAAGATDPNQAPSEQSVGTRNVVDVSGTEVDLTPPDAMVNAAELAREKKSENADLGECGTGVGAESGRRIVNDEITADRVEDIAAYLTSHEDDVQGITDPPTDWDEETWTDGCGPVQYALWGGTATGTSKEWAQGKANEVARARDEDEPYPNV